MHKILCFLVLIFPVFVCSQPVKIIPVDSLGMEIPRDTSRCMSKDDVAMLKTIKVIYKKPINLTEVPGVECFKANPKLELMLTCIGNQLHSKNAEFITFLPLTGFLTKADSTSLQQSFPNMVISNLNNQHCYQIRAQILYSLGKDDATLRGENAEFNWK